MNSGAAHKENPRTYYDRPESTRQSIPSPRWPQTDTEAPACTPRAQGALLRTPLRTFGRSRLQRAWDNYADTYLLDIAAGNLLDVREGVTLDRAFVESAWGNDNPLIVEIGTGQGENVAAAAAARPETNFLALEVYDPGVAHTLLLAGKQGLGQHSRGPGQCARAVQGDRGRHRGRGMDLLPRPLAQDEAPQAPHRAAGHGSATSIARWPTDGGVAHRDRHRGLRPARARGDGRARRTGRNAGQRSPSACPLEHVGKGNAELAADMPHADFTESERFEGRVLTNFEKKGLAAGRVIHDLTYQAVTLN